jgi:large subunit ribosomal protein L14e
MLQSDSFPQVGQFVLIKRGRDIGQYAIIVRLVDKRFVLIADGNKRKFDCPRQKNISHLQLIDQISSEVQSSIIESGRVTNGKLRFALTKYLNLYLSEKEKGDLFDGER